MPSTTTYNFGDVVLVAFPFTNLIISKLSYQQHRSDIILMAITSQMRQPPATDEALIQDWQTAGLAKASVLKPLIATIEQNRIIKTIGSLSEHDQNNLVRLIKDILAH